MLKNDIYLNGGSKQNAFFFQKIYTKNATTTPMSRTDPVGIPVEDAFQSWPLQTGAWGLFTKD